MEEAALLAAAHDLLIQTHISENPSEADAVLAVHSYGGDYLGIYEATGLVTRRTLLAHAIHLSPAEWDRIAAKEARIAHCPDSNFFLGSGRMRLVEASRRGIEVGLGSDVAAGRSFNMRRAMAYAYDNALTLGHPIAPEALLTMATLGGARALGLDAVTGSLEPGKDADFIALHLPEHVESKAQIVGQIAFGEEGAVEQVYVRGRRVV
jgi:guanine deaminase